MLKKTKKKLKNKKKIKTAFLTSVDEGEFEEETEGEYDNSDVKLCGILGYPCISVCHQL